MLAAVVRDVPDRLMQGCVAEGMDHEIAASKNTPKTLNRSLQRHG